MAEPGTTGPGDRTASPAHRWKPLALWHEDASRLHRVAKESGSSMRLLLVELFVLGRDIVHELVRSRVLDRAESLAYGTLMALVPLSVAFSSLIRGYFANLFPDLASRTDLLLNLVLPYQSPQIRYHLNRFAENAETASVLGLVVFIIVSFRLFSSVEATVNEIWHIPSSRSIRHRIRSFTMLFFWGPILIGLSFTTEATLGRFVFRKTLAGDLLGSLIPPVVLLLAFTMLFWLLPSTRVRLLGAVFGAAITTALFQSIRWGFSEYADSLIAGRLNVIYGTLGLLFVFLISLEVLWTVILLGVVITQAYQRLPEILRSTEHTHREDCSDLYVALRASVEIARRFEHRLDAPTSETIARVTGIPEHQTWRVLRRLGEANLIHQVGTDDARFVPGGDPEKILVTEIVQCVEASRLQVPELDVPDAVRQVVEQIRVSTTGSLGTRSLAELARSCEGSAAAPAG